MIDDNELNEAEDMIIKLHKQLASQQAPIEQLVGALRRDVGLWLWGGVYEDDLNVTDSQYDFLYPDSQIIDGVRVFPKLLVDAIAAAKEQMKGSGK